MTMTAAHSTKSVKANLCLKSPPLLDPKRIPHHVAIVMDGNRRWAKSRFLPAAAGHWKGAETLLKIIDVASSIGIKVLTLYSFSTENWNRSSEEISVLMNLLCTFLRREKEHMIQEGVRLNTIGDLSPFSRRS